MIGSVFSVIELMYRSGPSFMENVLPARKRRAGPVGVNPSKGYISILFNFLNNSVEVFGADIFTIDEYSKRAAFHVLIFLD